MSEGEAQAQDNTEAPPPAEAAEGEQETFGYWLAMLPFVAGAGLCLYQYSQSGDMNNIVYALLALFAGLIVAWLANSFGNSEELSAVENSSSELKS